MGRVYETAADFEGLLPKVRHVFAEIEGRDQDLHLLHQDLERQRQALSIALESTDRFSESVEREIEANRLECKRFEEIYEILQLLLPSLKKATSIEEAIVDSKQIIHEAVSSSTTSATEQDESDGDAAKILIDLCAQEDTAPNMQVEEMEMQLTDVADVGCRFQPTDQELIRLLKDKIAGKSIPTHIRERNLYGNDDPATIFGANPASELYFVTQIKKKFDSGKKNSRIVGNGTWKIQNNKNVYEDPTKKKKIIGEKRALNFVDENTKKDKISWIMHEYKLCAVAENPDRWVICRIKRGKGNRIGLDSPPSSITNANDDEVQNANNAALSLQKKRRVRETAHDEDLSKASKDDELKQPKKRRVLETLDLTLSLGLPPENDTQ